MKYIIELPDGWKAGPDICPMPCNCAITKCPLAAAVPVMTLEEYQKANPKRPTVNEAKEIYIVA